jgi:branched-chain amino acid transport system permease protein
MPADHFVQYLMSGLTQGSVYALVGLGFAIIFTVTGIINFAQGEFVMLGGIFSYIFFTSLGLPLAPSVVLSVVVATAIGCILYLLGIRPARKASTISLIIITIGAAIFIRGVVGEFWGRDFVRPPHFSGNDPISLMGASIDPQRLWIIGTALAVTIVLHVFLSYTVVGKALRACSVNRLGATLVGIDFKTMALIAFALAAAIGAVAGIVVSPLTTVWVNSGIMLGLKGFVAAAIGGFRSPLLAVVGGLTLGIIESFAVAADWGPLSSAYKDAIALAVLILILSVRATRLAAEERAS